MLCNMYFNNCIVNELIFQPINQLTNQLTNYLYYEVNKTKNVISAKH